MKYTRLLLWLVLLLTSCSTPATPLATSTFTLEPTVVQTPTPTSTPSPSPTPAYSYLPVISASNATEVTNFYQYDGEVSSLAFSPNGKYLAASFANGAGIIWDISAVKGWNDLQDAPKDIFLAKGNVSFDPDSRVLATGGTLIDLLTRKTIQELPGTVVFSPNRNTLALYNWNAVSSWNFDGNQWIMKYKEDTQDVVNVAFSPDGSLLGESFDWGGGEGVKVRRVADHTLLYSFPSQEYVHPAHFNMDAYAFLAFSPDDQFVATGTRAQADVRIWDLKTGKLVKDLNTSVTVNGQDPISGKTFTDYADPDVACVAFDHDSKVIILAGDNIIIFKTFPAGEFINEINIDPYTPSSIYITACATSEDGRLLAIGDSNGNVGVWSAPPKVP